MFFVPDEGMKEIFMKLLKFNKSRTFICDYYNKIYRNKDASDN
jgi:hypothetical protein